MVIASGTERITETFHVYYRVMSFIETVTFDNVLDVLRETVDNIRVHKMLVALNMNTL